MGRNPFQVVAHSPGALPALTLAEAFDLASLTMIAPLRLAEPQNVGFLAAMAAPEPTQALKKQLDSLTKAPVGLSATAID